MNIRSGYAAGDGGGLANRVRPAYGVRRPLSMRLAFRMGRTSRVRCTVAMRRAFALPKALRRGLHQCAAQYRRQADPKRGSPHTILPGGPGAGTLSQADQHFADVGQGNRGSHYQE